MSQHPFALYNPALLPPDVLLAEFTARRPMLETLLGIIRGNAAGQPPQHCLLLGARGMGKTTTLWAVAHRVNRDFELARQWQPVVFDEESRRVGDLADFWLEAIRQWEHAVQDTSDRAGKLLAQGAPDIEDRAREDFLEEVQRSGKRALLLIDNLNGLLGSIHDPVPLHRLRAFLMQESRVMIVGAASRYFNEITSVDQPFYEFFRCFELRPLSLEDMRACLMTLAGTRGDETIKRTLEEHPGTVQALHLLTGGNPRLIKTFYRLLRDGLQGDIRADLEKLLDEFTPYFKANVDALPVQQQRIFDAVALAWDPVEVANLATATRLPSNQVSAQLRALAKAGLISEAIGHPKRKTYLLTDRFSNIHYLMRHGRAARNRFDWFVALVRLVFPDQEARDVLVRVAREAAECGPEGERDARAVLQSALNRADSAASRRALLHATLGENWDRATWASLDHWFDTERAKQDLPEIEIVAFCQQMPAALRKKLGYQPENSRWWFQLTDFLEEKEVWPLAEAAYRKAIELDPSDAAPWNRLAVVFMDYLGRPVEAEAAYRKAIELDPNDAIYRSFLGNLLADQPGRAAEAEAAYRKAIELDSKIAYPLVCLGILLTDSLSRLTEAEAAFRKAIELDPKHAFHWVCLGDLLMNQLRRPTEAETAFRKAIELDPKDAYPWVSVGRLLENQLDRPVAAEAAYHKAIELDSKSAYTWDYLGDLLADRLSRPAEAEDAYRKAIELDPKNAYPRSSLADLLSEKDGASAEARASAVTALQLKPDYRFARSVFRRICQDHPEDWRAVLPALAGWCVAHPKSGEVFDFTVDGFLHLARLTNPAEALSLLEALPDTTPFETLRDAFRAHADRAYLHRLAPERQHIAIELLSRLSQPPASKPVTASDRKR
jgi:tetratricopeptide (TPR) repeat protein